MYESQKKFSGNLHALRGIAALMVVFLHAKNMAPRIEVGNLSFVQHFGGIGVTLFFILSGFSLCLSNFEKIKNPKWLYSYTVKRISRILPIWYIFIAIHFFHHWIRFGKIHSFSEVLYLIVPFFPLVPGGHESFVWAGWTIGVELMFYMLLPYLLICVKDNIKGWVLVTILLILISVQFENFAPDNLKASFYYMGFARQAFIFILGCTLFFIVKATMSSKYKKPIFLVTLTLGISFFLFWMLISFNIIILFRPYLFEIKVFALGFLVVVAYLNYGNKINLFNKFTKFLGDKSYTLYLAHPIVVFETKPLYPILEEIINNMEISFLTYSMIVIIITSIVATFLSVFIEAPLYAKGKRYAEKITGTINPK